MTRAPIDRPEGWLSSLLWPTSLATFEREYLDRGVCHVHHGDPNRYRQLFDLEQLEHLLETVTIRPSEFELLMAGQAVPVEAFTRKHTLRKGQTEQVVDVKRVMHLYQRGATIYIDRLDCLHPAIADLRDALDAYFCCSRIKVSVLATAAGTQGFGPHFDTHDVAVLQLAGGKHWKFYPATTPLPTYFQESPVEPPPPGTASQEVDLRAGDFLYFPRGLIHDVRAPADIASLHLTVSLAVHTEHDYANALVDVASQHFPALNTPLPPPALGRPCRGVPDHVRQALHAMRAPELAGEVRNKLRRACDSKRRPRFQHTLHTLNDTHRVTRGPSGWLCLRAGVRLAVEDGHSQSLLRVSYPGGLLELPSCHSEAIALIAQGHPVRVEELPGLSLDQAAALVDLLIPEGVLVTLPRTAEPEGSL